jgi:hypothetical protein|tara:strand:- start:1614 stop:1862 length:249 start_codon:yes stop_codon:yes gene_type:complete
MAKSKVQKEREAREVIVTTIAKIQSLEPTHGGKWREGMLKHYYDRLAELMLYQQGLDHPDRNSISSLAVRLRDQLGDEKVDE